MTYAQLSAALGYPKFRPGRAPRMLLMQADYLVYADLLDAAKSRAWGVEVIDTPTAGEASPEFLTALLKKLVAFKPDFVLSINHTGFDEKGVLAGILEQFDVPLASWFVDHPMPILGRTQVNACSNCQVFCFERTALDWLAKSGFEDPVYLPTASNPENFHPRVIDLRRARELGRPLSLVAGSWWQRARVDFPPPVIAAARQLAEKHPIDRHFVREGLAACLQSIDLGLDRGTFDVAQAALAEASMRTRQELVLALKSLEPVVFGDPHWSELVEGIQLEPAISPVLDLPALFTGSQVNLNVTAEQMPTAVNQRVWDVPGAGGFLLTDAQEDVHAHFDEGVDVVTYSSHEEALDKARHYLVHPAQRSAIAAHAHQRVEREHRTVHRLLKIEDVLRRRFAA